MRLHAAVAHRPQTPEVGRRRLAAPASAALNVLFDDDAAVSEERTGQRLQESPGVGAGVEGLHVAQGWTLAADYASCGVDLPVQDNGAAQTHRMMVVVSEAAFTTFTAAVCFCFICSSSQILCSKSFILHFPTTIKV